MFTLVISCLTSSWWTWWACRQAAGWSCQRLVPYEVLALFFDALMLTDLCELKSMLLISWVTYLPAIRATLFGSSGKWQGRLGEVTALTELANWPIHFDVFDRQIFLCLGHPLMGLHLEHKYLHFFASQRCQTTYFFPKYFCHQFFNHVPFKSLIFQPFHGPQPMNQ